jgi:hypothetical protein
MFKVSWQAALRELTALVEKDLILREGDRRGARYVLGLWLSFTGTPRIPDDESTGLIHILTGLQEVLAALPDPRYFYRAGKQRDRYPNQKIYGGKPALVH